MEHTTIQEKIREWQALLETATPDDKAKLLGQIREQMAELQRLRDSMKKRP